MDENILNRNITILAIEQVLTGYLEFLDKLEIALLDPESKTVVSCEINLDYFNELLIEINDLIEALKEEFEDEPAKLTAIDKLLAIGTGGLIGFNL